MGKDPHGGLGSGRDDAAAPSDDGISDLGTSVEEGAGNKGDPGQSPGFSAGIVGQAQDVAGVTGGLVGDIQAGKTARSRTMTAVNLGAFASKSAALAGLATPLGLVAGVLGFGLNARARQKETMSRFSSMIGREVDSLKDITMEDFDEMYGKPTMTQEVAEDIESLESAMKEKGYTQKEIDWQMSFELDREAKKAARKHDETVKGLRRSMAPSMEGSYASDDPDVTAQDPEGSMSEQAAQDAQGDFTSEAMSSAMAQSDDSESADNPGDAGYGYDGDEDAYGGEEAEADAPGSSTGESGGSGPGQGGDDSDSSGTGDTGDSNDGHGGGEGGAQGW
jgi:hypothetical protein